MSCARLLAVVLVMLVADRVSGQVEDQVFTNDGVPELLFGEALDMHGEVLAVGVPGDFGATNRAFVFRKTSGTWSQEDELLDPAPSLFKSFGRTITTNGSQAVVSSSFSEVYVYAETGGSWSLIQTLPSTPQGGAQYGQSVAMDGDTLLVSAPGDDTVGPDIGAVWAYRWNGSLWVVEQQLLPTSQTPGSFGFALDLDGDVAVFGATGSTLDPGEVRVFRRSGASWTEEQILHQPPGPPAANFGASVTVDGERLAITCNRQIFTDVPGCVLTYVHDGGAWVLEERIDFADDDFTLLSASPVELQDDLLAVGTPWHDGLGDAAGAVQLFRHDGAEWWPQARLYASNPDPGALLGASIALDGASIVASVRDVPWQVHAFTAPDAPLMWRPEGAGSGSAFGVPTLEVAGTLFDGEPVRLTVGDARPFAFAFLVVGVDILGVPFKGGVLVPSPDLILSALSTDAGGVTSLIAPWPGGLPPLFDAVFQGWILDDTAASGFTSTRGLVGTILP